MNEDARTKVRRASLEGSFKKSEVSLSALWMAQNADGAPLPKPEFYGRLKRYLKVAAPDPDSELNRVAIVVIVLNTITMSMQALVTVRRIIMYSIIITMPMLGRAR